MNVKMITSLCVIAGVAMMMSGCCSSGVCTKKQKCEGKKMIQQVCNDKFYKDGKFDSDAANKAYFDLMKKFNYPVFPIFTGEKKAPDGLGFWAVDFAQGQFASFGMGGVIFVNEKEEGYFGHDIYLLPGQSIAEHCHKATKDADGKTLPAKTESWLVRAGYVYGFSEVGTPNIDEFPEAKALIAKCQIKNLNSVHVEKWEADGIAHKLPKTGTWHFMMGGAEGAIVSEFATYHDGSGLRFSCPGVAF